MRHEAELMVRRVIPSTPNLTNNVKALQIRYALMDAAKQLTGDDSYSLDAESLRLDVAPIFGGIGYTFSVKGSWEDEES